MNKSLVILFLIGLFSILSAQDKAFYEKKTVWGKERQILTGDFSAIKKPVMEDFKTNVFHFDPVRQDTTGTCWAFSTISFFESDIYRQNKKKVKLAEMYVVYWDYVEKARRFIQEKGHSLVAQGSESNSALNRIREYGIVPHEVYTGLINGQTKHNHDPMAQEIVDYLDFCKDHEYWDEEIAISNVKNIMNKYIGVPPERFEYQGKTYTPITFRDEFCQLNPDDYVDFMSTLQIDFYTKGEYKVPDNWWHSKDYYNIPLDDFYKVIKTSIQNGYSMVIGGDVSEPGKYGEGDIAVIVPWDLPEKSINQSSREFRFYNKTSTDDHGIHLIGFTHKFGHDWFLIKDSGSSSHSGKYKGYYFFRDDFVKLKMLSFTIHKDAVKDILNKF